MFVIPSWLITGFFIIPVLTIVVLLSALVISTIHCFIVLRKTNKYIHHFGEWTQAYNCNVMIPLLMSFFWTAAGLIAGVQPEHIAMGLWYVITNVICLLYWVFLIDYYILKSKGMVG